MRRAIGSRYLPSVARGRHRAAATLLAVLGLLVLSLLLFPAVAFAMDALDPVGAGHAGDGSGTDGIVVERAGGEPGPLDLGAGGGDGTGGGTSAATTTATPAATPPGSSSESSSGFSWGRGGGGGGGWTPAAPGTPGGNPIIPVLPPTPLPEQSRDLAPGPHEPEPDGGAPETGDGQAPQATSSAVPPNGGEPDTGAPLPTSASATVAPAASTPTPLPPWTTYGPAASGGPAWVPQVVATAVVPQVAESDSGTAQAAEALRQAETRLRDAASAYRREGSGFGHYLPSLFGDGEQRAQQTLREAHDAYWTAWHAAHGADAVPLAKTAIDRAATLLSADGTGAQDEALAQVAEYWSASGIGSGELDRAAYEAEVSKLRQREQLLRNDSAWPALVAQREQAHRAAVAATVVNVAQAQVLPVLLVPEGTPLDDPGVKDQAELVATTMRYVTHWYEDQLGAAPTLYQTLVVPGGKPVWDEKAVQAVQDQLAAVNRSFAAATGDKPRVLAVFLPGVPNFGADNGADTLTVGLGQRVDVDGNGWMFLPAWVLNTLTSEYRDKARRTVAHEFGHALGLDHPPEVALPDKGTIMDVMARDLDDAGFGPWEATQLRSAPGAADTLEDGTANDAGGTPSYRRATWARPEPGAAMVTVDVEQPEGVLARADGGYVNGGYVNSAGVRHATVELTAGVPMQLDMDNDLSLDPRLLDRLGWWERKGDTDTFISPKHRTRWTPRAGVTLRAAELPGVPVPLTFWLDDGEADVSARTAPAASTTSAVELGRGHMVAGGPAVTVDAPMDGLVELETAVPNGSTAVWEALDADGNSQVFGTGARVTLHVRGTTQIVVRFIRP